MADNIPRRGREACHELKFWHPHHSCLLQVGEERDLGSASPVWPLQMRGHEKGSEAERRGLEHILNIRWDLRLVRFLNKHDVDIHID